MRKVQLFEPQTGAKHAGSKAPGDVQTIAAEFGFEAFRLHRFIPPNRLWFPVMRFCRRLQRKRYARDVPGDSVVFAQFPTSLVGGGFNRPMTELVRRVKESKRQKVVSLVHDVECIRGKVDPLSRPMSEDLRFWCETADVLIVHNRRMADWFQQNGIPSDRLVPLELFDYLAPGFAPRTDATESRSVCIAGNLDPDKAGYLAQLADVADVRWELYGPNYRPIGRTDRIRYHGTVAPERLPERLEGGFGLVWDGDSVESCSGGIGEYLKVNSPHKLSLYLAAELPVIVWEESAAADFVRTNDVGLTVRSLREVGARLAALSEADCARFKRNACGVSEKLRAGHFTKAALAKALALVDNTPQT